MTSPLPCPACGTPLSGTPTCSACGLRVQGPEAARLWQVDQQLAALQQEREALLARLRLPAVAAEVAGSLPEGAPPAPPRPAAPTGPATVPVTPRRDAQPLQVQNTLLVLGAVLLVGAGLVFAAVTYQRLGVGGRAAVLLVLTAAAAWAPLKLLARSLRASAEALGAVAVALLLLDAWSLRRAGFDLDVRTSTWWAAALLVVGLLAAGYGRAASLRSPQAAAVVLLQLPVVVLLERTGASAAGAAAALVLLAGADLAAVRWLLRDRLLQGVAMTCAGVVVAGSLSLCGAALEDGDRAVWVALAWLGVLAAGCAWLLPTSAWPVAVPVVPLLAAAAWAGVRPELTADQEPLVLAACATTGAQLAVLVPRARRLGLVAGGVLVAAVAVVVEARALLEAVLGPLSWVGSPWTREPQPLRDQIGDGLPWTGSVVTLVVVAAAALTVLTAGALLDRLEQGLAPAGALLVLAAVVLPAGLATPYRAGVALELALGGLAVGAGALLVRHQVLAAQALAVTGVAVVLLGAAASLAEEQPSLVVLPVAAVLTALATRAVGPQAAVLPLLLATGWLAALGVHQGLDRAQVGGLLLVSAAVCTALAVARRSPVREAAEAALALVALAAITCSAGDPGWLSWCLAGTGVAALGLASRPDRRAVGLVGALLLSAATWVRLADAEVTAPEPYAAPVAVAAFAVGFLRHRSHPLASSWEVYGSGLLVALVPTLLRSFVDERPDRAIGLLLVALGVALVGAWRRLQAPLGVGAAVAALAGLRLLAPYADAVPQWVTLGGAGLLLVVLGATYESRLRDLRQLRDRFDALS